VVCLQTGAESARPHARGIVGFSGAQTHRDFQTKCADDAGVPLAFAKTEVRVQPSAAFAPLPGPSLACAYDMPDSEANTTHRDGCERFPRKPKPPPARFL
jgi:hypothetical protein